MIIDLPDADATTRLGAALAPLLAPGDAVLLKGPLGMGKSTLARGLIRALTRPDEDVPSPTFTLVQTYADLDPPVAHADLYRLESAAEAEPLALDDWLLDGALLLEWPERLGASIWPDRLLLRLDGAGGPDRRLTWDAPPAWEGRWPAI